MYTGVFVKISVYSALDNELTVVEPETKCVNGDTVLEWETEKL